MSAKCEWNLFPSLAQQLSDSQVSVGFQTPYPDIVRLRTMRVRDMHVISVSWSPHAWILWSGKFSLALESPTSSALIYQTLRGHTQAVSIVSIFCLKRVIFVIIIIIITVSHSRTCFSYLHLSWSVTGKRPARPWLLFSVVVVTKRSSILSWLSLLQTSWEINDNIRFHYELISCEQGSIISIQLQSLSSCRWDIMSVASYSMLSSYHSI